MWIPEIQWTQDIRFALRSIARRPRPHLLMIAVLGIGLGASIAVVDLINLFAWRPLPVAEPDRVVKIFTAQDQGFTGPYGLTSYLDYRDYSEASRSLIGLAASWESELRVDTGDATELRRGMAISGNYPQVLGLKAHRGRVLTADDETDNLAMISHSLWQELGADDGALDRRLLIEGQPFAIVGVLPAGFNPGFPVDFYFPAERLPTLLAGYRPGILKQRSERAFDMIGRLRPGFSKDEARAELTTIAARLDSDAPLSDNRARRLTVTRALVTHPVDLQRMRPSLRLLIVAVVVLLLITCANVTHLLTAEALTRQREIAVRRAMGAGPWRLWRQQLLESSLLTLAGGVLGLLFARGARIYLVMFGAPELAAELRFDTRVLSVSLLICLSVAVFFGSAAVWSVRKLQPAAVLKGSGGVLGHRRGVPEGLAGLQIALCVVLLAGTALLTQSLRHRLHADLGFEDQNLCIAALDLSRSDYSRERALAFFEELRQRAEALPGVERVGSALIVPPLLFDISLTYHLPHEQPQARKARINYVDGGYFDAMGIPLEQGRNFNTGDNADGRAVVVLSRRAAQELWPGQDPIGRTLEVDSRRDGDPESSYTVVGVVGSVTQHRSGIGGEPVLYFSVAQRHRVRRQFVLRSTAPADTFDALRSLVREMDPGLALTDNRTGIENRRRAFTFEGMQTTAVGLFAAMGFLLAVVGVFAAMSYAVGLRIREIGIRMAIGARPPEVLRQVLSRSLKIAGLGTLIGLIVIALSFNLLKNLLFGITVTDVALLSIVPVAVLLAAAAAGYLPARRAAGVDPLKSLRCE